MRINYWLLALFFTTLPLFCYAQESEYLTNNRLRIDLILSGTPDSLSIKTESYTQESEFSQPNWSYVDQFNYGQFLYELTDLNSNNLLYSNGFSSLFSEWQINFQGLNKDFTIGKTIQMPMPKNDALLTIYSRDKGFKEVAYTDTIKSKNIRTTNVPYNINYSKAHYSGNPKEKLDILVLGDGYKKEDLHKFKRAVTQFKRALFNMEPFKSRKNDINIWSYTPITSENDSISNQRKTPLGCGYNTLESDRYLYTYNNIAVADYSSQCPYDQIVVLANSSIYGGGGIYNDFAVAAANAKKCVEVMIHEFGHSFVGLADEYAYDAPTDSTSFYSANFEPWEPNITNLVNFESKWKSLMVPNTPTPTPDSLSNKYPIGLYEGAGYQAKGVYRPCKECLMRVLKPFEFCPICKNAINLKIDSYVLKSSKQ